jgi:hypothetical protein
MPKNGIPIIELFYIAFDWFYHAFAFAASTACAGPNGSASEIRSKPRRSVRSDFVNVV